MNGHFYSSTLKKKKKVESSFETSLPSPKLHRVTSHKTHNVANTVRTWNITNIEHAE